MRRTTYALVLAASLTVAAAASADDEPPYFATRLGGESVWVDRVAAAPDDAVVAAGRAWSSDLPAVLGPTQVDTDHEAIFVSLWSPDGRPRWSVFLRTQYRWSAEVRALRVAGDGSVWVTGHGSLLRPDGSIVPGRENRSDSEVWIAKFDAAGAPVLQLQFGGSREDRPLGLVLTPEGDAIVAGRTDSPDFPVAGPYSDPEGGGTDGFVARVQGDGSGLAWVRRVGGADFDSVIALASVPGDGFRAVTFSGGDYAYGGADDFPWRRADDMSLLQIASDGTLASSIPLPRGDMGGMASAVAAPDGAVYVGGTAGYFVSSAYSGQAHDRPFVLRLDGGAASAGRAWSDDLGILRRIARAPSGEILAGSNLWFENVYGSYNAKNTSTVRVLSADLDTSRTLVPADRRVAVLDLDAAPDGAVCLVGIGPVVVFNAFETTVDTYSSFVARIPLSGSTPPSQVRVVRTGLRTADLEWTDDGDPWVRHEVERIDEGYYGEDMTLTLAATGADGARVVHVTGLEPGTATELRPITLLKSGVRVGSPYLVVSTRPSQPFGLRATPHPRGMLVEWDSPLPGANARYELQRRISGGRWRAVTHSPWFPRELGNLQGGWGSFLDGLPPLDGEPVEYRARAVTLQGGGRSAWTYARSVRSPAPTLRVTQASGRVAAGSCTGGVAYIDYSPLGPPRTFQVSGTFGQIAGSSAPTFDPMRHDLRIWVGDAGAPIGIVMRSESRYWSRGGLGWIWSDFGDNGTRWHVEIDPSEGSFLVRGCIDEATDFRASTDTVLVGISYAGYTGGEVRTWRRLRGLRPNLLLP